jgi:restriction system protein
VAIPDYQTIMLPLLRLAGDGQEHKFRDTVETLAAKFGLTADERSELLPSGTAFLFDNRVGWARTYLKQAGLLSSPKRGIFRITERGQSLLVRDLEKIDAADLEQFEEFRAFRSRRREASEHGSEGAIPASDAQPATALTTETPEDRLASAYRGLRRELELDLLEQLKSSTPAFFEQLVIDLLVAMGYGGSRQDAGRAIGKSGDGGIDGIIKEDKLGLDAIYVQAKRWEGTVGRPDIQKFAGALQGHRAVKGVFIATSSFTREALEYAAMINTRIILIGGKELVGLMIDHNVGVSTVGVYEVKKIDADYFEGE